MNILIVRFAMAFDGKLEYQSLGRQLTELEMAFASDLEAIFAQGLHTAAEVASALQARGTRHPSGSIEAWSEVTLEQELAAINASLDAAYAQAGTGA
jgi:hypothetical protein